MKKLIFALIVSLALATSVFGQGAQRTPPAEAYTNEQGYIRVLSGAQVTVCPSSGTGSNCAPGTVNLFYDPALTVPMTNPFYADANGGYSYYVTPGTYGELVCSPGFPCNFQIITLGVTGAGTGSVTAFSAGNLSPLFTTSVATPTSTPALTFSLSNAAANTIFGNFTGSGAAPSYNSIAPCGDLTDALGWAAGTGFYCQAISGGGGGTVGPGTPGFLPVFTTSTTIGNSTEQDSNSTFVSSAVQGLNAAQGVFNGAGLLPQTIDFSIPNGSGTTQFYFAKSVGGVASTATVGDTQIQLYPVTPAVVSNGSAVCAPGSIGTACLVLLGRAVITADAGGVAVDHYIGESTTVAGAATDLGAGPDLSSGKCLGQADSAIAGGGTGAMHIGSCPTSSHFSTTVSSATPGTVRTVVGAITTNQTTMTSGNLVGSRGEATIPSGTTVSGGFVYGSQGKLIVAGSLTGGWETGGMSQLDLSAATGLTTSDLSVHWFDLGATAPSGTVAGLDMLRTTNTTAATPNSFNSYYGQATYLWNFQSANGSTWVAPSSASANCTTTYLLTVETPAGTPGYIHVCSN